MEWSRRGGGLLYVSGGVLLLLVALFFIWPAWHDLVVETWEVLVSGDQARIRELVEGAGWCGPLLIVILMTLQMFLIIAPSWLLMVVAVVAYGPLLGSLISLVSVLVAAVVGYGLGRLVGERALGSLIGRNAEQRVTEEVERYGVWAVLIARVNPLLSNDAISFVAGVLRMGFRKFVLATLAGIAPLVALIAIFGREAGSMKSGLLVISLISLVGLGAKVLFDRQLARPRNPGGKEIPHEQPEHGN